MHFELMYGYRSIAMRTWVMCVCRSIVPEEIRPLSDVIYIANSPCTHLGVKV